MKKARIWLGCVVLAVAGCVVQTAQAQGFGVSGGGGYGGGGYGGGNGGGYNNGNGYSTAGVIPRVSVAPNYYGGGGISHVTIPTRTVYRQQMARQFFIAGGIPLGQAPVNGGYATQGNRALFQ